MVLHLTYYYEEELGELCTNLKKAINWYMKNSGRKSIPLSYLESKGLELGVQKLRVNIRLDIEKFIKEVK